MTYLIIAYVAIGVVHVGLALRNRWRKHQHSKFSDKAAGIVAAFVIGVIWPAFDIAVIHTGLTGGFQK